MLPSVEREAEHGHGRTADAANQIEAKISAGNQEAADLFSVCEKVCVLSLSLAINFESGNLGAKYDNAGGAGVPAYGR